MARFFGVAVLMLALPAVRGFGQFQARESSITLTYGNSDSTCNSDVLAVTVNGCEKYGGQSTHEVCMRVPEKQEWTSSATCTGPPSAVGLVPDVFCSSSTDPQEYFQVSCGLPEGLKSRTFGLAAELYSDAACSTGRFDSTLYFERGVCYPDSGDTSFMIASTGLTRLSYTDASCTQGENASVFAADTCTAVSADSWVKIRSVTGTWDSVAPETKVVRVLGTTAGCSIDDATYIRVFETGTCWSEDGVEGTIVTCDPISVDAQYTNSGSCEGDPSGYLHIDNDDCTAEGSAHEVDTCSLPAGVASSTDFALKINVYQDTSCSGAPVDVLLLKLDTCIPDDPTSYKLTLSGDTYTRLDYSDVACSAGESVTISNVANECFEFSGVSPSVGVKLVALSESLETEVTTAQKATGASSPASASMAAGHVVVFLVALMAMLAF
eukprot:m.19847 g.19847  ORF g.19847 m.19847 type:complete len:438 (+) comp6032_c1_seq1:791-2104(+)